MKIQESIATGPHSELLKFSGEWSGNCKTWFEPDVLADESQIRGRITAVLSNQYIKHEYEGTMQGKPYQGELLIGYHLGSKKILTSWANSFHTGTEILFGEGDFIENGLTYHTTYFAGEGEPRWGWRTTMEWKGADELVVTAYNILPDGGEAKAVETVYTRIK